MEMSTLEGDLRTEADAPLGFDPDSFQGIVADAVTLRLDEHNGAVTLSADLVGELGDLVDEWVEEVEKLEAAEANLDSAIAAYNAADTIDKETLRDGVIEAQDALDAARREYTRRETEILAKLADIIERMGGIGGDDDGKDKKSERDWRKEQDEDGTPGSPEKPVSPRSTPESPGASESPGGDTEPSVTPAPGSTDLSTAATPTTQQSAYPNIVPQAQQQQMPTSASPAASMPSFTPSPSFRPTTPKDKDKDKKPSERNLDGVYPVASPVPVAAPIDRGSSTYGTTSKDVSGKTPGVTNLSSAGQTPGGTNQGNPRGGMGGGMMGGAPMTGQPLGAGSKSTTSKIFDRDRTLTRPDEPGASTPGGALSKDSLAAQDKAETDAEDQIAKHIREQNAKNSKGKSG